MLGRLLSRLPAAGSRSMPCWKRRGATGPSRGRCRRWSRTCTGCGSSSSPTAVATRPGRCSSPTAVATGSPSARTPPGDQVPDPHDGYGAATPRTSRSSTSPARWPARATRPMSGSRSGSTRRSPTRRSVGHGYQGPPGALWCRRTSGAEHLHHSPQQHLAAYRHGGRQRARWHARPRRRPLAAGSARECDHRLLIRGAVVRRARSDRRTRRAGRDRGPRVWSWPG